MRASRPSGVTGTIVAVDWGTSRLRAFLLGPDGAVRGRVAADSGIMTVPEGGYEAILRETVAPLREGAPDAPILMSGMVGSRQGWIEAPYVPLPATADDLAAATVGVAAPSVGRVAIVGGVAAGLDGSAPADVMRGEETEVFGALAALGETGGTFVLPGTHAKWVRVERAAIVAFRTFMTGEVYAALSRHTILSRMMEPDADDPDAFLRGVAAARGLGAAGDLLARLFTVRAETLFGRLAPSSAASFLSGLLVGAEVASAAAGVDRVVVVGAAALAQRYRAALGAFGVAADAAPADAAARGLHLIAARGAPALTRRPGAGDNDTAS